MIVIHDKIRVYINKRDSFQYILTYILLSAYTLQRDNVYYYL